MKLVFQRAIRGYLIGNAFKQFDLTGGMETVVIVDVEATPTRISKEVEAAESMIERTEDRFGLKPKRIAGDVAYGKVAMVSDGLEPVADDSGKGNSPFAAAFLDVLRNNADIMDGTRLFSEIRRPVILNAKQTPQYSDVRQAGGDFLFVRKKQGPDTLSLPYPRCPLSGVKRTSFRVWLNVRY